jgi:hypothetical protein
VNVAWRVRSILRDPSGAWQEIEREPGDAASLLAGYVAWLALVPAVFGFIGAFVVGAVVPGAGSVRAPLMMSLSGAVFGYVASCATVLVLGLVIELLAPLFGGRRDFTNAFKLAVYAYTPVWLAGIFTVAPGLRFLGLFGLYGAYILWTGLPVLMKAPEQKVLTFTALTVVCAGALTLGATAAQHALFGPAF